MLGGYTAKGFWLNLTVCDLLDRNVEVFPDKPAFAHENDQVTWSQLQERVNWMAFHLKELGVE